jgi:hypothetical protein
MEALKEGQLFKPREATICWKERHGMMPRDIAVRSNDLLVICDANLLEVIPGLYTVRVLHPRHGIVTCILDELVPVNQDQPKYS